MPLPFHRRRLDPDAADFCRRSGATDRAAINAFVRGVKDLGLWDSMVCWPLRSAQNAGFGDTAYSLGGLGTFNGTLVNLSSGAWGASGITNSATGHITTNYFETGGSQTHIFVGNSTTANALRAYGSTLSNSNTKGMRFRDDATLFGDGALQAVFVDLTSAGNFKMASAIYQRPTNSPVFLNKTQAGTLVAGNAMVAGENSLTLLAAKDGSISQYYSGQAAFYATVRSAITTAQYLAFYDLYRNTLGTGLGLP